MVNALALFTRHFSSFHHHLISFSHIGVERKRSGQEELNLADLPQRQRSRTFQCCWWQRGPVTTEMPPGYSLSPPEVAGRQTDRGPPQSRCRCHSPGLRCHGFELCPTLPTLHPLPALPQLAHAPNESWLLEKYKTASTFNTRRA